MQPSYRYENAARQLKTSLQKLCVFDKFQVRGCPKGCGRAKYPVASIWAPPLTEWAAVGGAVGLFPHLSENQKQKDIPTQFWGLP